jgi:hypothetical protein
VPVALARLQREGAVVTTSESFIYECVGDAGTAEYVHAQLFYLFAASAKFNDEQLSYAD